MKKLLLLVCIGYLCVTMLTAQQLENSVRDAVVRLSDRLLRPLDVSIGSMTLDDGTTVSPFSRQLYNLVLDYATNNVPRFRVVEVTRGPRQPDGQQRGTIKGTFAKRNDMVEVFLILVSADGTSLGSHRFTFPLTELTQRGISLEPENLNIIEEQKQIFTKVDTSPANQNRPPVSASPANQNINIQAFFNSESMTYLHRDELKLTVFADRDCYFKIIHIDVNNQIKMIFPTRSDNNNFLRANVGRNVFDNQNRYMLYGPYGAETLVFVASPVQFPNIEREYNEPWKAATEETIRAAAAGAGHARYPITIIKPHEEYEYAKPENMTELYQSIRDDAVRQGGHFEGNATSGFYIINNIRGSYRVPSGRPGIIEFAVYDLNAYAADSYSGTRTRGSPFNFSFTKPQNIAQAVQTVRGSILENGGTFTGNEQQGNFRANGITGQYQVTDVVNVTISEKPFVVPNSLIENEVKKYFGVR